MRFDPRIATLRRLCACALLLAAGCALAQTVPDAMRVRMAAWPQAQRDAIVRREAQLRAMTPAQRAAFERRIAAWHALPEHERRDRRDRWQAWRQLPDSERARLRAAAADFAALPVQTQLGLRSRYAGLGLAEQRGWLLGPALGRDFARLQPLVGQVPEAQRAPLLATLRAMTPQQRGDLGVLAQRTPPQQRDALRRELLATPAARRSAWLQGWLDR